MRKARSPAYWSICVVIVVPPPWLEASRIRQKIGPPPFPN